MACEWNPLVDQDAMSIAAKALGYPGAARLISEQQLSACQVSRMLLSGAALDRGKCAAVIVLAAATARHHFEPIGWNGEAEKTLAVSALDLTGDRRMFDHAAEMARKIVQNAIRYRIGKGRCRRNCRNGLHFDSLVPNDGKRGAGHPAIG